MNSLVSVVINTYNRKKLLKSAIDSSYRDKYKNKEVIVVDDCSSDDVSLIIDQYSHLDNFKYIRNQENMGLAHSRNIGWQHANGEYVAFLDDDDQWIDEYKLTKQVKFLDGDDSENYFLVATSIVKLFEDGRKEGFIIKKPVNIKKHILKKNGVLYPSTALIRKKHIELAGGFDTRFSRGIDSDVYRSLILKYDLDYEVLEEKTVLYRLLGGDSITAVNEKSKIKKVVTANLLVIKKYWKYYLISPVSLVTRLKIIVFMLKKYLERE